jgi:hypothetical protein
MRKLPPGVDDQQVSLVSNNDLTAAISRLTPTGLFPDAHRILTYKRVVDFFHQAQTVIPIRYGCKLNGRQQIVRLLEEQSAQYGRLLSAVKGRVEMGIRILISECARPKVPEKFCHAESITSGRSFLADRKAFYEQQGGGSEEIKCITRCCRDSFAGLYVNCKTQTAFVFNPGQKHSNSQLVSLYFLVPRGAVEHFRQVFRQISQSETAKFLLSGPWPPYNFVMPDSFSQPEKSLAASQKKSQSVSKRDL